MKIEVIKTHKKITLKTETFTFSTTINRYSCSGNLNKESFDKLVTFIEDLKGLNYGERFDRLAKPEVLKKLIKQDEGLKIGDYVNKKFGKHVISGTIIGERKNAYEVESEDGLIQVVQKVILL